MDQKKDRRIQYTKMVLREALLDLLKTKVLNKISITELCREADINRNTFYNHYSSPYEILNELETEIYDEMMEAIKNIDDIKGIVLAACKSLESNKKLSEFLFTHIDSSKILSKILTSVKSISVEGVRNLQAEEGQSVIRYVNDFAEKGAIAVIQEWVLNGFKETAEAVADLTSFLILNVYASAHSYRE